MNRRQGDRFFIFRVSVVVTALLASGSLIAQEVCGLASVQYNRMHGDGFESSSGAQALAESSVKPVDKKLEVDLTPSARKHLQLGNALGYAPRIIAGIAPTITIAFPASGASFSGQNFEVRGTFTGPVNTGISVNGSPALTFGNQWVSLPIHAPVGSFEISATATTFDAMSANATRMITVGNAPPEIELVPKQAGNIAPATIGFTFRVASGLVIETVQVDFNGDGNNDYVGPLSGMPTTYHYTAPGLYTAKIIAVTPGGQSIHERSVLIADVVTLRERACSVYGALRASLAANDLEATLNTFIEFKREAQRPFFTALGSNRSVFATRLGTIANGVVGMDSAQLITLRIEGGQPIGYPVSFAAEATGVWRIASF